MSDLIIGLGHRSGMGKDAVGDYLVEMHGFVRVAFADALKDVARDLSPFLANTLVAGVANIETAKNTDPRIRNLLITLGNSMREHVSREVWVASVVEKIRVQPHPVVVTDVRFPEEVKAIHRLGGSLIKVTRPQVAIRENVSDSALACYTGWDMEIQNNEGLPALYRTVDQVLNRLYRDKRLDEVKREPDHELSL